MTRGAIFDLDGTLLDSMHVWEEADAAFLGEWGFETDEMYLREVSQISMEESAVYTIERYGLPLTPEAVMARWQTLVQAQYAKSVPLKPGAQALLRTLHKRGWRLGVATALQKSLYEPCLRRLGVWEYFCAFAGVEEARDKAYPDIYLLAAERMDVEPRHCVVFEDIAKGLRGAKGAGMQTVGVYDETSAYQWPEIQALADRCVMSLEELCE